MRRKPKGKALFREIFQMYMVAHALRQAWSTHNGFQDTQGYIVRTYLKKSNKKEKGNYLSYQGRKGFFLKKNVEFYIKFLTGISGSILLAGYLELSNNLINRNNNKL